MGLLPPPPARRTTPTTPRRLSSSPRHTPLPTDSLPWARLPLSKATTSLNSSSTTPQGSPIVSPGSVSKTSSPQPQPAYAAYQPPHDGSHEVAGYPPQGNPTNQ